MLFIVRAEPFVYCVAKTNLFWFYHLLNLWFIKALCFPDNVNFNHLTTESPCFTLILKNLIFKEEEIKLLELATNVSVFQEKNWHSSRAQFSMPIFRSEGTSVGALFYTFFRKGGAWLCFHQMIVTNVKWLLRLMKQNKVCTVRYLKFSHTA